MFFINTTEEKYPIARHLGENAFSSALILMSLYKYDAALVMFVSSIEAFLSDIDNDPKQTDKRSIWIKLTDFEKQSPDIKRDFRYYAECDDSPGKLMKSAVDLRNTITHANTPEQDQALAAEAISRTILPILQAVYKSLFGVELISNLLQLAEFFNLTFYLRKNGNLKGNYWVRSLAPITWRIQNLVSPNYEPKYLWDKQGYRVDKSDLIWDARMQKCSSDGLESEGLFCPICDELSIGVSLTVIETYDIEIDKAHCVNCQLDLGENPLDRLISNALFDTYLTENEPQLRKEFGLP